MRMMARGPRARTARHVLAALLFLITSPPRFVAGELQPAPVASYTIDVRYDSETHTLTGHETIDWRNTAARVATELRFHLYQNAFANNRSSFFKESGDDWRDWVEDHPEPWGYTEVESIRIDEIERVGEAEFVQPDDGNVDDRTVLNLPLKKPVPSGGTLRVEIAFTTKLPHVLARSGHSGPFALIAQWFPKLGVFSDQGWNCHQYHRTSEFYADFGTYDVTIRVPGDSVIGATGEMKEDTPQPDGTRRVRFLAQGVHDFAMAIDPRFEVVERTVEDVRVRLLIQPGHRDQAERYLGSLARAMRYFREGIGRYPYETLTLVDPGAGALGAGGMEYPTLITLGTAWWMPQGLRFPEVVTIHEFGHQYWYGVVANNEFEDAWIDEGINSYVEGRIMDSAYGPASYVDLFGLQVDSLASARAEYLRSSSRDPMVRAAWQFLDRRSYVAVSYAKTALVLNTLARRFGEDKVATALRRYFETWGFRHPKGSDFIKILGQTLGEEIAPIVEQGIYGTGVVDYAIASVSSTELEGETGYTFDRTRAFAAPKADVEQAPHYHNEVVVERLGEVRLPVQIAVQFDDGTTASASWDGESRWRRLEYTGTQQVDWAVVDPDLSIPLDVNRLNNSRMREAGTRGLVRLTSRWGFWFQSLLHLLTAM
jgi:hypothetical protein